ncbi:hypothetical protein [Paractinoplanes maris]|uniref:hypothetical protein n=1 Tax=Paractinoplanes maris TaxID=1734446 RepID=UPI0020216266|nr:hypothetical protein [Actinoplanes maris]
MTDTMNSMAAQAEAAAFASLWDAAPTADARRLGMVSARAGARVTLAMRTDPTGGYWNRALGLGLDRPVDDDVLDETIGFFRDAGVTSAVLSIPDALLPQGWDHLRDRYGIGTGAAMVKLVRAVEPLPVAVTDLRIERVDEATSAEVADVYPRGFGMSEDLRGLMTASFAWPGTIAYGAWAGTEAVGASVLVADGEVASLSGAVTLPAHRRRGGQSAMLAARAAAAAAQGVRWLFVDVEEPESPGSNQSYNTMLRFGFRPLRIGRDWVWREVRD